MDPTTLKSFITAILVIMDNPSNVPGGRIQDMVNMLRDVHGDIIMDIYNEIKSVNTQKVEKSFKEIANITGELHRFERNTADIVYENILSRERDKKLSTLNIK